MMRHFHRSPAIFVANTTALDFLNSSAGPAHDESDCLARGDGLIDWLDQTRLVRPDALEATQRSELSDALDRATKQARELREWFGDFVHN
jgi:hypothetical protein